MYTAINSLSANYSYLKTVYGQNGDKPKWRHGKTRHQNGDKPEW